MPVTSTIAVVVATYGDERVWGPLAARAVASVEAQTSPPDQIVRYHGSTLAQARNTAAKLAGDVDHLVFLDADDQLDRNYIIAMRDGADRHDDGPALYQPATLGVYADGSEDDAAVMIAPRGTNLLAGNHLIVGTMVDRDQFLRVGGFGDYEAFEDWALWGRCWIDGAELRQVPEAVYRVSVRDGSRNQMDRRTAGRLCSRIRGELEPLARNAGLL